MDIIDRAQRLDETARNRAIRRVSRAVDRAGSEECVTCGEIIPAARRRTMPGASHCIECQEQFERRNNGR